MTATKEGSLPLNREMVLATLAGLKTNSRRPVKFKGPFSRPELPHVEYARDGMPIWFSNPPTDEMRRDSYFDEGYPCPYGKPGDVLRISESCRVTDINDETYQVHYAADNSLVHRYGTPELIAKIRAYKNPNLRGVNLPPAYARRERLELTGVRVERVKDISEADAIAEGIQYINGRYTFNGGLWEERTAKAAFQKLWTNLYGEESWFVDWCWVLAWRLLK
jgi:hypothetical protein